MKVVQILLVLAVLVSLTNALGIRHLGSDSSDSSDSSDDGQEEQELTKKRYVWGDNEATNAEADQASEEVRNDWTEALAVYDPYEELDELEKLQLYNEWKVEAKEIVQNNPDRAYFKLYKNLSPAIGFYNVFAKKHACEQSDLDMTIDRVWVLLEGLMGANGYGGGGTCGGSGVQGRRQLGGGCNCSGCNGGYTCCWRCGGRRRRLSDAEELEIEGGTPDKYESLSRSIVSDLIMQCESIVHNIGVFYKDLNPVCRDALSAANCAVRINVWDAVSLVVDGNEKLAAEMIEEKLLAGMT